MSPREDARRGREKEPVKELMQPEAKEIAVVEPKDLEEIIKKIEEIERRIQENQGKSKPNFPSPSEYPVRYSQAAGLIVNAIWIVAYGQQLDPAVTAAVSVAVQSLLAIFAASYLDVRKEDE